MGIGPLEFEFMLWEHKYRPITGEVLTIGKPAVALSSAGAGGRARVLWRSSDFFRS